MIFVISFFIIYVAVRLAINPLIEKKDTDNNLNSLNKIEALKYYNIINDSEQHELMALYNNIEDNTKKENKCNLLLKYLDEINELGYFNEKEYNTKKIKLLIM